MSERIYELSYKRTNAPVYMNDIGQVLKISGIVFQGNGDTLIIMFPGSEDPLSSLLQIASPDDDVLCEIMRASDDPQYLDDLTKTWLRKSQRGISGKVQQIIWVRDGYKCMYCGRKMGDVQLGIDHFVPLEAGGANDETNYLSCCNGCNKSKGNMPPREWCRLRGYNYDWYVRYLSEANNRR